MSTKTQPAIFCLLFRRTVERASGEATISSGIILLEVKTEIRSSMFCFKQVIKRTLASSLTPFSPSGLAWISFPSNLYDNGNEWRILLFGISKLSSQLE